jgi:hypothetical protein
MIGGLEEVDLTSSEGKEFMSILSELDKRCPSKAFRGRARAASSGEATHEG